jgi:hypothetical protein
MSVGDSDETDILSAVSMTAVLAAVMMFLAAFTFLSNEGWSAFL